MSYEITDELIDRINPNPPCDHCEVGSVDDVERDAGPNGDTVELQLCTSCWMTEDGGMFLPPKRRDSLKARPRRGVVRIERDEYRPQYRHSSKKIMCGAIPAYDDVDEDYGTDDGTADYEAFVTA